MLNHDFPAFGRRLTTFSKRALVISAAGLIVGGSAPAILAAPGSVSIVSISRAQNVSWLSPDQAASLAIGIDVLVPSWVPAPFDSVSPSISASGGYYELYWMIPGGVPTFLQIQGVAGGSLPAGSPADLNKELEINASVQGFPAIHDVGVPQGSDTPIYDQVWWVANGVMYSVSSLNMTGSDTMSLANSLISLQAPAPSAPEPAPQVPAPQPSAPPADSSSGTGPVMEDVPPGANSSTTSSESASSSNSSTGQTAEPTPSDGGGQSNTTNVAETVAASNATTGPLPSDGTGGPNRPVIGSDGTGGTRDMALPRIP